MRGKRFPDETDWLSFFETEPDERFEKGMPIEYQSLTFRFENQDEQYEKELLIIVEAYGDFITTVEITFLPFFSVMMKEHFSGE
ncbi:MULTISPECIES: hypothetical protein [unclassified Bacillus (in: firmicutes)]|uniref:hypothetical protein n=1 Tax=unclassified Bacillus (in: firmicutes) TaxID=185979 RepID=UPI0030CB1B97